MARELARRTAVSTREQQLSASILPSVHAAVACTVRGVRRAALPVLLGVLACLVVTGARMLQPSNVAWLSDGDPATYFLGWHFFRNTPWTFPLGLNPRYGAELSGSLALVDNVPLLGLSFKLIAPWLPEFFQYFGLWTLGCFALQAWFAWLLVGLVTRARWPRAVATLLFVFAPPFLWRLQGHYAMEGQWLVLAALYLCFARTVPRRAVLWPLLALTASLIHSYMTAMVLGLWLSDWARRALFEQRRRALWIELGATPACVALGFWQAGLFVVKSGLATDGFGYYRLNLLSLFDPSGWSYVIPDLPEGLGDYEGFAYLGAGGLLLLAVALPALRRGFGALRTRKEYWPLLGMLVALTGFALSNRVGFAGHTFALPLPPFLLHRAELLRCSGRMFWPVYYVLVWVLVRTVLRIHAPRVALTLLAVAALLQVVDTSAGWLPIRADLLVDGPRWRSPLKSPFWARAARTYQEVRLVPPRNRARDYATFAYFAATHGLSTDAIYFARVDQAELEQAGRAAKEAIQKGRYAPGALYILESHEDVADARKSSDAKRDLLERVDGFWVLAPGWKCRPQGHGKKSRHHHPAPCEPP
jgi:hypothetical protein